MIFQKNLNLKSKKFKNVSNLTSPTISTQMKAKQNNLQGSARISTKSGFMSSVQSSPRSGGTFRSKRNGL